MKKKLAKALLYLMTGGLAFFVVTFTVYFFNLDMKLTSMIEPFLLKWYDRIPRNQHLEKRAPIRVIRKTEIRPAENRSAGRFFFKNFLKNF